MSMGKATPRKPVLPRKPQKPRPTGDAAVDEARAARHEEDVALWEVDKAKHDAVMEKRKVQKKHERRQTQGGTELQNTVTGTVASGTMASTETVACCGGFSEPPPSSASQACQVAVVGEATTEVEATEVPALIDSALRLHQADLEAQRLHPESGLLNGLHPARSYNVTDEYRRGEHHCLCFPRNPPRNPLGCCCGKITSVRLTSQRAWCAVVCKYAMRCGAATAPMLYEAGYWNDDREDEWGEEGCEYSDSDRTVHIARLEKHGEPPSSEEVAVLPRCMQEWW